MVKKVEGEARAEEVEERRKRHAYALAERVGGAQPQTAQERGGSTELRPIILAEPPPALDKPRISAIPLDYAVSVERRTIGSVIPIELPQLEKPRVHAMDLDYGLYVGEPAVGGPVLVGLPAMERPQVGSVALDFGMHVGPAEIPPPLLVSSIDILTRPYVSVAVDTSPPKDLLSEISSTLGAGAPPEALLELALEFRDAAGNPAGIWHLYNCEGTTLVAYPPDRLKLDESLAVIALEVQRIVCGKSHDARFLDVNDDLDVLMRDEGVYVIRGNDLSRRDRLERIFDRFSGFAPKVVIVGEDLRIPSKPSSFVRVLPRSADALKLVAIAYTGFADASSAMYCRDLPALKGYDIFAVAKSCWYAEARRHLAWALNKAPEKLRPSVGGAESESHLLLKAIAIRYAVEVLGLPPDSVKVEDEVKECGSAVPDLYFAYNGRRIAVDVKASIGVLPTNEVRDAAEKYSGCADEVWVLLRPMAFLAFTRPILKTMEHLQRAGLRGVRVMLPLYDGEKGIYKIVDVKSFLELLAERAKPLRARAI